ncbi:hypothetical protein AB0M57_20765 [Streptomyces sp. NPDC051597]|uniref:hypothetical protein n=1 Tax=Streptomyces sp. NPDC051597 TaxID=3155049 RepID=UPI00343661C1
MRIVRLLGDLRHQRPLPLRAYLAALPEFTEALPPGAHAFASDAEHYRRVHEIALTDATITVHARDLRADWEVAPGDVARGTGGPR